MESQIELDFTPPVSCYCIHTTGVAAVAITQVINDGESIHGNSHSIVGYIKRPLVAGKNIANRFRSPAHAYVEYNCPKISVQPWDGIGVLLGTPEAAKMANLYQRLHEANCAYHQTTRKPRSLINEEEATRLIELKEQINIEIEDLYLTRNSLLTAH